MRIALSLPITAALALTGCYDDAATLDTRDGGTLSDSVSQMTSELAPPQAEALGDALFTLSFGSETPPGEPVAISALAREPERVAARLRHQVDGLTAQEIIDAARTYKLVSVEGELDRLQREIEKWSSYAISAKTLMRTIALRSPRYYWHENGTVERAVIDFEIVNNSPISLKRIVVMGNLQSPSREIPWARGTFSYTFPGGLEPGERQRLKLLAHTFGAWSQEALREATDADLTLALINVRDAHDTPLIPTEVERLDEMRAQIRSLEAERTAIMAAVQ